MKRCTQCGTSTVYGYYCPPCWIPLEKKQREERRRNDDRRPMLYIETGPAVPARFTF